MIWTCVGVPRPLSSPPHHSRRSAELKSGKTVMTRWPFSAVVLLLATSVDAAPPTAEDVRVNARRAGGFDAFQKLPQGIVVEGKAEYLGIPGTFRLRLAQDGRYVRVISAKGEHAIGFDGTSRWARNFSGPIRLLEMEEGDRDLYLFGVLGQRWLAEDGGFTVVIDSKNTSDARVCLTLTHRDAGVSARLYLDRATWWPERLEMSGANGLRVTEFSDVREVAGVRLPARVAVGHAAGGQRVTAECADVCRAGDKTSYSPPVVKSGAKFDPNIPALVETKRVGEGLLFVRPQVNGKTLPWFLVDTGNGALTGLTTAAADRLDLPAFGGTALTGVGAAKSRFRQAKTFTLGSAEIADLVLMEFPQEMADALSRHAGVDVAGVVGWDFMLQAVVEIDYQRGAVAVHDPARYRLPVGASWEPVRFNSRMPCVKGTFEGKHDGLFMFDTGLEAKLLLHAPAVRKLDLLKGRETVPMKVTGVGGATVVRRGTATEFRILGQTQKPIEAAFAAEASNLDMDPYTLGTFGIAALGPGTVVFDYPNRRIAFIPKP